MADSRRSLGEGTSQGWEHDPLPKISVWTTDNLTRLVSATVEELLCCHLALIPQSVELPEELAIPQEESTCDSTSHDLPEKDSGKHQEASQKGKRVLIARKDVLFTKDILEAKLLKHFCPLQIREDRDN